jgi:hypothetical protein
MRYALAYGEGKVGRIQNKAYKSLKSAKRAAKDMSERYPSKTVTVLRAAVVVRYKAK